MTRFKVKPRRRFRRFAAFAVLTSLVSAAFVWSAAFSPAVFAQSARNWGAPESFAVVNPAVRSELADVVSLDGDWDFKTGYFNYRLGVGGGVWGAFPYDQNGVPFDATGSRKIKVPGAWEVQGVGEPGPGETWDCLWDCGHWDLKHVYSGCAVYRKTVEIPARWADDRVWLKVGGVRSNAYIWVDGKRAAFVDAYCGARKFDITPFVKPGKTVEITALVRNDVPARTGLLGVNHKFGGFYRSVELEATPNLYVDDVWVRTDVEKKTARVRVYSKKTDENGNAVPAFPNVSVKITKFGDKSGKVVGVATWKSGASADSDSVELEIPIENCELWTPENPALYVADVVINGENGAKHGWTERFGVRELKVVGDRFFLNGKPYFLRGCGDHNYDVVNLFEPADRDRFKEHMTIYKTAGFNYARFHTHCPFPEYFEAADEKGILLQPEIPYYHDVPTEGFPFDPKRDLYELFRTNRRYVSFATYSFGNEGYLGSPLDVELRAWLKEIDPDRLVIHQDGGNITPENSDFTTNARGRSVINPWEPGLLDEVEQPFIAHEYLNLAIKMDPRYESRFTGIRVAPVSVARWEKALADVGLNADWGAACVAASEKLQGIYQKRGLESARLDPACDGYSYWSLVDASIPQGNCVAAQGYLNPFWEPRPNGVQPKDFYRFNGPTALLLKTDLGAPILVAGEKFNAEFRVSHFDAETIPAGVLDWKLVERANPANVVASGSVEFGELVPGTAGKIAEQQIETAANAVEKPLALDFVVSIRGTEIVNSWEYWVFPKRERRSLKGFAVSETLYDFFAKHYDDVEKIPAPVDEDDAETNAAPTANDGKIWIVSTDDVEFFDGVTAGRKMLAISPASATPNVALGWWSIGTQIGTAFADSPAFGDFPNSPSMDELWFRLIRAGAPDLKSKPFFGTFEPLAVGEGLDSYYLYLAQTKVGDAKILGTFAVALEQDAPEALGLLDELLEYVESPKFDPKAEAKSAKFDDFVVPPGVVWGFSRAVRGGKYVSPSLYSSAAPMNVCRQNGVESELEWRAATFDAAKLDPNGSTTFAFVGGLGYWSQPKTAEGFEFCVEGKPILKFDLPESAADQTGETLEWTSEDGAAKLTFEIQKQVTPGPDFFGVFRLTVPNSALKAGAKRATFGVRSTANGSLRWFAVNEYRGLLQ